MRVLIAHNHYQQQGGEDAVVETEYRLLKDFGEEVLLYERSNEEIKNFSALKKLHFLCHLGWSEESYQSMRGEIKKFNPDVVHFHNIFYMLTPSVYWACRDEGVPVVQSQHNFRLLCANALLFRNDKVCEECIERKNRWRSVYYGCYKESRFMTASLVQMINSHWRKRTWVEMVDAYIMATAFGKRKYVEAGIPEEKIFVKPHVFDSLQTKENRDEGYALYVGRLSAEKGVDVLLNAWSSMPSVPLKIIGDGPLAEELRDCVYTKNISNVEFLGFLSHQRFDEYMKGAKFLIVPSICYENFPRIVAEAYAYGVPVLASHIGGMPEVIEDGKTGLLFKAGDSHDLAAKIRWLVGHDNELAAMRENIRQKFKNDFTPQKNCEILMNVYRYAIARKDLLDKRGKLDEA